MKKVSFSLSVFALLFIACTSPKPTAHPATTIAFGSCGHEDAPQPVLDVALQYRPDYFIYLGDNIYGDSYSLDTLRAKYRRLGNKPEFQRLQSSTRVLATWDDHDYGWDDSGRHYPLKEASKTLFLDFWKEPAADNTPAFILPIWKNRAIKYFKLSCWTIGLSGTICASTIRLQPCPKSTFTNSIICPTPPPIALYWARPSGSGWRKS